MKFSWLRAAILGVLIGPVPADAEPGETEPRIGGFDAAPAIALPGRAIRGPDFYVWDEDPREASDWARELLDDWASELLDAHAGAFGAPGLEALAARAAARAPLLSGDFDDALMDWVATAGEASRPSSLGLLLCLMPALDRTCLISSWAVSPDERVRVALAGALATPFDAVGVGGALERLLDDPSAEVRSLARVAEAVRRRSV